MSTWQGQQYSFIVWLQDNVNSPILYHNTVHGHLDRLDDPQNITLVYYIDDMMMIGSDVQGVPSTLDTLVRHKRTRA